MFKKLSMISFSFIFLFFILNYDKLPSFSDCNLPDSLTLLDSIPQRCADVRDSFKEVYIEEGLKKDFLKLYEERLKTPGGIGVGVYYNNNALFWNKSTTLVYNIIVPEKLGGDISNYLYLTSSNRSEKGVEAFINYYGQGYPGFYIFDWALVSINPWVFSMDWSILKNYLFDQKDASNTLRKMVKVTNSTALIGQQNNKFLWKNSVLLYNPKMVRWDLIYEYIYETTTLEENTFQPNDTLGFWGPIIETFSRHLAKFPVNPIGFYDAQLILDDNVISHLSETETYMITKLVNLNVNGRPVITNYSILGLIPNNSFTAQ